MFPRESPLHLTAARSISKAMDVLQGVDALDDPPAPAGTEKWRPLATDIAMLGFAMTEAGRDAGERNRSLREEYQRLLEEMERGEREGEKSCRK